MAITSFQTFQTFSCLFLSIISATLDKTKFVYNLQANGKKKCKKIHRFLSNFRQYKLISFTVFTGHAYYVS